MRRFAVSLLAIVLGAAAAATLVSCGGGDARLLPGNTASEITANLDQVEQLASSGDCAGAQNAAQQVSEQIDALGGIDKRLKQSLRDGAVRLNEVVANCAEETTSVTLPTLPETTESTPSERPKKGKKPKKDETTPLIPTTTTTTPTTTSSTPTTPTTVPTTPTAPTTPSGGGGGTGAPPGGVAPGSAADGGD